MVNYTNSTVTYTWSDDLGNKVGTSVDLPDVKPGKYMLSVKLDDNSCVLPFGPVEVRNVNGVAINETKKVVKPSILGDLSATRENSACITSKLLGIARNIVF